MQIDFFEGQTLAYAALEILPVDLRTNTKSNNRKQN